jgi:hypothetical protein
MTANPRLVRLWTVLIAAAPMAGCGAARSPSLVLFGSYFPSWMMCAIFGLLVAIGSRIAMVRFGLTGVLPFQLFICVAIGVVVGVLAWLLWSGF